MLESGRILAARYRLLRKLGEGRTTQVWLARDAESGAAVHRLAGDVGAVERDRAAVGA